MMIPGIRWQKRTTSQGLQIDLGDGSQMAPEDVLDGHLTRLFKRRTVQIQTDDNLRSAITILAPDLAPLTDLAEDLADVVPDVQPEAQFRQDLHRALELTHRQHAAQRLLGTDPYPRDEEGDNRALFAALGLLLLAALTLVLWGRTLRAAKPEPAT